MIINNTPILQHMTIEEMDFLRDILGGAAFFIVIMTIIIMMYKALMD